MQCVILAGGKGTRMAAYTTHVPKSLIPVNGKPFIDHQLRHLAATGVTDVVLCVGDKGQQIQQFVNDGSAWELRVRYVDEGDNLRGTAGALRLALDQGALAPEFLVTFGDSYLPIDFSNVWRYFEERTEPILMTVYKNAHRWGASNVRYDGEKVTLYDKEAGRREAASLAGLPAGLRKDSTLQFLDYGLSGIRRAVIQKDIPAEGSTDLADVMKQRSLQGDIAGMEVNMRFYEVGSPEGLTDLSNYLSKGAP